MLKLDKILIPVDLSEFSARAIEYGADLARLAGARITVLTVVNDVVPYFDFFPVETPPIDYFEALKEKAERELESLVSQSTADLSKELLVRRGYPAAEIVEVASTGAFDLIVMATHGHAGLQHALLGSITEKVLRKAHCPVLVVR